MINTLRVKGYRCLQDVEVALTPFHAFIGPNDSGKSTILGAIRTLGVAAGVPSDPTSTMGWLRAQLFPGAKTILMEAQTGDEASPFRIKVENGGARISIGDAPPLWTFDEDSGGGSTSAAVPYQAALTKLSRTMLVRLNQAALRSTSPILTEAEAATFPEASDVALAGVLEVLQSRADGALGTITEELQELFPTVAKLQVPTVSLENGEKGKAIRLVLRGGQTVDAQGISEGMLYYLAVVALARLGLPQVLLVEEPENGLHPARIVEVVKILREAAKGRTQVIMATHSPLVINEMKEDEVTLVTRSVETGTLCTPIVKTKSFVDRSKVYSLGELWLSYANGSDEKDLVEGTNS